MFLFFIMNFLFYNGFIILTMWVGRGPTAVIPCSIEIMDPLTFPPLWVACIGVKALHNIFKGWSSPLLIVILALK